MFGSNIFASIKQGVGKGTCTGGGMTGFPVAPMPLTGAGTAVVAGVARPGIERPTTKKQNTNLLK